MLKSYNSVASEFNLFKLVEIPELINLTLENKTRKSNLWYIHGEINYCKSIMLGFDHYCGYIGKIDSYVKGTYRWKGTKKIEPIKNKIKDYDKFKADNISWVELFFNSDVHIIGFSLDYSEIDIWWILTKRARMIQDKELEGKINNNIYFYGKVDSEKKAYLESFEVKIIEMEESNEDWHSFYEESFIHMVEEIDRKYKESND